MIYYIIIKLINAQDDFDKNFVKMLAKLFNIINNNATTKLKAVSPNRHTLAFFTPTVSDDSPTSVNIPSVQDAYSITSYGGLIGVNTTPNTGNNPSRLLAVVETRHPFTGLANLTKLKGNPSMNNLLSNLSHLSPIQSFCIGAGIASFCSALALMFVVLGGLS